MAKQNLTELLTEARAKVAQLTQSLPQVADPAAVSFTAKTPWKALLFRETLIWRTEELARVACDLYEANQLASGLTITRSCVEGVAACWYLNDLLQKAAGCRNIAGLDDKLMRLIMGSRNKITDLTRISHPR